MSLHHATREALTRAGLDEAYASDAYTKASIDIIDTFTRSMIQALDEEGFDARPSVRGRIIRRVLDMALPSRAETEQRLAMTQRMIDQLSASGPSPHGHEL